MFKKIALATALITTTLTGSASAAMDESTKVTFAAMVVLTSSVCEAKVNPEVVKIVGSADLDGEAVRAVGLSVINSWNNSPAKKAKWCNSSAKALSGMFGTGK